VRPIEEWLGDLGLAGHYRHGRAYTIFAYAMNKMGAGTVDDNRAFGNVGAI
jgi:hypothetical protein